MNILLVYPVAPKIHEMHSKCTISGAPVSACVEICCDILLRLQVVVHIYVNTGLQIRSSRLKQQLKQTVSDEEHIRQLVGGFSTIFEVEASCFQTTCFFNIRWLLLIGDTIVKWIVSRTSVRRRCYEFKPRGLHFSAA